MSKKAKKKQLLIDLGFTAEEVQVAEELAAKHNLNTTEILRVALKLYQARDLGLFKCEWKNSYLYNFDY